MSVTIPEFDAGEVIIQAEVSIPESDSLDDFGARMRPPNTNYLRTYPRNNGRGQPVCRLERAET